MRALKIIGIAFAVVFVVITATGIVLPGHFAIEKSTTIAGTPAQVMPYLTSFQRWNEWSDFGAAHDPKMKIAFSGPPSGVGNTMSWTEGGTPPGKMEIVKADDAGLVYDLTMDDGSFALHGTITVAAPTPATTTVTWKDEGDMGANPYKHILGKIIASSIGATFESSLEKLKRAVEAAK